jgi:hypothetical protein
MLFIGSQLALIALGLIPLRAWRSFRAGPPAPPSAAPAGTPKPQPA